MSSRPGSASQAEKATPAQIRPVADFADDLGRRSAHVTIGGGLEIHNVRIENVPVVWAGLRDVALTTKGRWFRATIASACATKSRAARLRKRLPRERTISRRSDASRSPVLAAEPVAANGPIDKCHIYRLLLALRHLRRHQPLTGTRPRNPAKPKCAAKAWMNGSGNAT
jgi:hypothetical protein